MQKHTVNPKFLKPLYCAKRLSRWLVLCLLLTSTQLFAVQVVGFKAYPEFGITKEMLQARLKAAVSQQPIVLADVARDLTLFYRDQGLSFHQVMVVQGNLVLVEGLLTNVVVPNLLWSDLINDALADLKGKVVFEPRMRNTLLKFNHWPGIELFSFYSVADSNGGVNLNVIVKASKTINLQTSVDNFGAESLGKHRLLFNANVYNVLVRPSQLGISGHVSNASNNYSLNMNLLKYQKFDQLWKVNLSAQRLSLDNTGQILDLEGSNLSAKVAAQWNLQPSALKSNSRQLWFRYSQSELSSIYNITSLNKSSDYLQFGASYSASFLSPNNKSQVNADTQWIAGYTLKQDTSEPNALWSGKVKMNSTWRHTLTKGLYRNQDVALGFSGQLGNPNMHSSERFSLTGQGGLTQFEPSKGSTEQALLLDAKLFALQGNVNALTYNLVFKAQAGLGYSKPTDDAELIIKLSGASVQSNVSFKDVSLQASYEQPIVVPDDGWDQSGQVLFRVSYETQF
ncbi:hypothetical protein [Marinicellulosiphila megalodicopiae]|uniref:hypothetical protein n=1 Tax=Marinicellulosiphila megalodicopiae TaxID=2724896 RepID=UPI003BAEAC32